MKYLYTIAILSFIFWMGCRNDTQRKIINPNGDSELALLMRDMYDEGMLLKQDIINGENPEMNVDYHLIHTATPTEEGKNASPEYIHFAKAYEESVEQFENASSSERKAAYQNMVQNCMNCHSSVCPGPIVRIKKMYLTDEEMQLTSAN